MKQKRKKEQMLEKNYKAKQLVTCDCLQRGHMNYCTKDRLTRKKCFLLVPLASIGHSPLIKAEHYSFVPLVITSVFSRKMMGKPKVLQVTPISAQTCRYAFSSWHSVQDVIFSNFSCELVPGIQVQHRQFCSSAEIGSVLESL